MSRKEVEAKIDEIFRSMALKIFEKVRIWYEEEQHEPDVWVWIIIRVESSVLE